MPSVLITGAARGIGRVATLRLDAAGWTVIAGVRTDADGAALAAAGTRITPVRLDVTDAADVAALPDRLPATLDAVVDDAGIVVGGPVEAVPLDELRRQFDVNVVGQVAVTQAVLPRLRASRGRVVFVSSISGLVSNPMIGPLRKAIPKMQRMAASPDLVAAAIERAVTARRPRTRYVVGTGARLQGVVPRYLPTRAVDAGPRLGLGIPRTI